MFCGNCGNKNSDDSNFCTKCGKPIINNNSNQQFVVTNEPVINTIDNSQNNNMNNKPKFNFNINKVLIGLIVLIVCIVVFHVGYSALNKSKSRTIMIYMVGANLESQSSLGTRDLAGIDYNKIKANNTKVILMAGGANSWHNSYVDSNKTAIYELGPNGFYMVDNHDLSNMGSSQNLSYFLNYVYDNYKASKYNLIFWNHGGAIDGSEYDELNHNDNLSIPEIKQSFDNSPFKKNNKIEVISFRTCLNATLEMANALKDYSDYLVASEETTVGLAIDSPLTFINDIKPSDKPADYSKKVIDSYTTYITNICNYGQGVNLNENHCVNLTYSAIDLSKIDNINKQLDKFSSDINKKLAINYNDIVKLRASIKQYPKDDESYDMVDLVNLAENYSKYSNNSKQLINSINKAVIYNKTNNNYSNGLSIYFPYNRSTFVYNYSIYNTSKNYSDFILNFNNMKKNKKVNSFNSFSNVKGTSSKTEKGDADFEISLTDDQVKNFASAGYYVFVDMKDGYHKLVYYSNNPYLEGNKLKAVVRGKMLRIADAEYDEDSEWLRLFETESGDDFTEFNTTIMLYRGVMHKFGSFNVTVRIDKDHPNGYFKSIVSTDKDDTKKTMYFSENAVKLTDYSFMQVANQAYIIRNKDGKFNPKFWDHGSGVYSGQELATNMYKLILEDFNGDYDYYGVFSIKDVAGNIYYSDIVKMN